MKTYALFEVYDYKGGELSATTNMSLEDLLNELWELYYTTDTNLETATEQDILDWLNDNPIEESTYAGGDSFCGTYYEVEASKMRAIDLDEFNKELAAYIFTNKE